MEEGKTPEQLHITPPMYKSPAPLSRKRWIVGMVIALLLVGIIVAAALLGVYMAQKHTEKMVTLVLNARDGQRIQQTISTNEQENMAAIFISGGNDSGTVLYDYRKNLIGIRTMNSSACYVLRMDRSQAPSIQEILRKMDNVGTYNASSEAKMTYGVIAERPADPIDLGMSVNILCSNADIYWAKLAAPEDVRLLGVTITFTFAFSISIQI